jgi:hypothetical protein
MSKAIGEVRKTHLSKVIILLSFILLLTIIAPGAFFTPCNAEEEGLIGYWSFDELEEGDTEFLDLSGNGIHGTLRSNTHPIEGKFGKALKFNGLADYAEIPFESGLSCPDAMSFEAWIYPTPPHQKDVNGGIVNNLHGYGNSRFLITKTGMVMAEIYVAGQGHVQVKGPNAPSASWSHVVYVYDGTQGIVYVNGEPGTPISYSGNVYTSNRNLTIGWGHSYDNYHYNGLIDEIKIYNRALSPQEIGVKYNQFQEWKDIIAYPNPSSSDTVVRLSYWADVDGEVELFVYDESGKEVNRITGLFQEATYNEFTWDGKDKKGRDVPPGIYKILIFGEGNYKVPVKGTIVKGY